MKEKEKLKLTLVASDSEVSLLLVIIKELNSSGVRIISILLLNLLTRQSISYVSEIISKDIEAHVFEAVSDYS